MNNELRKKLDLLNQKLRESKGSDKQIIAANKRVKNKEYRKKLSKVLKGRIRTPEEIEKWKQSYNGSGERNGMFGRNHSKKTKQQISKNRKGKVGRFGPHSLETRKKMSKPRSEQGKANMRKPRQTKICPYCKHVGAGGIMLRWHFDNCKQAPK